MKILITGANGFVGTNLKNHFDRKGIRTLAPTSKELNLLNFTDCETFLDTHNPDIVIHLAALKYGIYGREKDEFNLIVDNTLINYNLIKACKAQNIRKVITFGSTNLYSELGIDNWNESVLLNTAFCKDVKDPYVKPKLDLLKLILRANEKNGFDYKMIIPSNIYGPYDNFNLATAQVIPSVITKVILSLTNKVDIELWGNGETMREFLFIDDLVTLIDLILNLPSSPSIINSAGGSIIKVKEVYELVIATMNSKSRLTYNLGYANGKSAKKLDCSAAEKIGWKPKTSIKEGLKKTIEFYLEKNGI